MCLSSYKKQDKFCVSCFFPPRFLWMSPLSIAYVPVPLCILSLFFTHPFLLGHPSLACLIYVLCPLKLSVTLTYCFRIQCKFHSWKFLPQVNLSSFSLVLFPQCVALIITLLSLVSGFLVFYSHWSVKRVNSCCLHTYMIFQ